MRWLNNTYKERINTKTQKEAIKLIDRAAFAYPSTANAQRRHIAELYIEGVLNNNSLRQLLQRVAYVVPPVSPVSSPQRPKKTNTGQSSPIPIPRRRRVLNTSRPY